jgi:alpha-glucosidase
MKILKTELTCIFLLCLLKLFAGNGLNIKTIEAQSPDTQIRLTVIVKNWGISYGIKYKDSIIIQDSRLGFITNIEKAGKYTVDTFTRAEHNEIWTPIYGKVKNIINHFEETNIELKTEEGFNFKIVFRLYNDGIAFRYEIPKQRGVDSLIFTKDLTSFHFTKDFICRGIENNIESSNFIAKPLSQTQFSKLPLLVQAQNCWIALNEASVFDFSMMYLRNDSATTMKSDIGISACALPMKTPWRVVQIGEKAGDLIESNILVNLNDPCKIKDPSWIRLGKSFWDWRNHGDTINGFVYGINESSYKRLIDLASEDSIQYVLFDADWYSEKGPQFPQKDLDLPSIIQYARKKNVGILLYIDRKRKGGNNDWKVEDVLKTFHEWGVAGIKYGFLSQEVKDRKAFVDMTREITRLCAKYKLLVDFHDNPVHPGGEERAWPNRMLLEYCHGQQDSRKSFSPTKAVTVPFVNGLSGALDMANGFYDLNGLQYREKVDKKGLNSTVVGETARCLINYSPLLILPDNGDQYNKKADLFMFIKKMPNTWDETKVLGGVPGEFIIIARKSGDNWFIAGNTNEKERTIDIPLIFLDNSRVYDLIKYQDAPDSDFMKNKESYLISKEKTTREKIFQVRMAPGGGFCAMILAE